MTSKILDLKIKDNIDKDVMITKKKRKKKMNISHNARNMMTSKIPDFREKKDSFTW